MNNAALTVTDTQIEQLRREAAQAGDEAMVAIANLALGHVDHIYQFPWRDAAKARELCVDAIAACQAQENA